MASAVFSSDPSSRVTPEGVVRAHDERFMAEARREAERGRGRTSPNPVVGALIVDEDACEEDGVPRVLSRGHHILAERDHAEVAALRPLGGRAPGKTLYVTLEPCNHVGRTGRCTDAILAAGITRVVCGMRDPNPHVQGGGIARLRAAGIAVVVGVQEAACQAQNRGFVRAMTEGRPQILLKAALSLDGRIAPLRAERPLAEAAPIWLSSAAARVMAHRLRASSDAILVGVGTVLADDPQLTVRLPASDSAALASRPLRVVLDSHLRTPHSAKLVGPGTLIVAGSSALAAKPERVESLRRHGCEVFGVDTATGEEDFLDLRSVLSALCQRGIQDVLCEGGATLHGRLVAAGLADEAALFVAPLFLGDRGVPLLAGLSVPTLSVAPWLSDVEVQRLGPDLFLRGTLRRGPYRPSEPERIVDALSLSRSANPSDTTPPQPSRIERKGEG